MMPRLLILLFCVASLTLAQDVPDLPTQARNAVSEKRFSDALTLYRALLAGKPTDVDYMLWTARLSAWTNDYTAAERLYDNALAREPTNVDALLGKANLLLWQRDYRDASVLLTEARALAPSNTEVELAWSRYYHWQGDDRNAKLYVEQCLASDGQNQEALELKENLVPDHTVDLRIGYELDTLPGTTPGDIGEVDATYFDRSNEIGIYYAHLNRFGEAGSRGGLHVSRKLNSATSVRAAALFGEGGDIVARLDLSLGISRKLKHGFVAGADYRHIAFRTLKVDAAIADLDYYFERPVWIVTSFAANRIEGATTPALLVRFNARVRKNLTLNAGYGHGTEIFQLALPTDFASFRRDSYLGGVILAFTRKTRAETTYMLARRSTGTFENMVLIAVVHTL